MTRKLPPGINACEVPTPLEEPAADLYRNLHKLNCARGGDAAHHKCAGSITITADSVTLSCPLCGDSRQTIPPKIPA